MVLEDGQFRAASKLDQAAQVPGGVAAGGRTDEHQVQRRGHAHAFPDAHHGAVPRERGVETREGLVRAFVATLQEVDGAGVAVGQFLRERARRHAFGETRQVGQPGVVHAVDEHQARGGNPGQQRGGDGRVGGRCERAPFQGTQRRVLPRFGARAGQAVAEHRVQRRAPRGIAIEGARERVEQHAHCGADASGATRSRIQA